MDKGYKDPNDYKAENDSEAIQKAVDDAVLSGCNRVKIPTYNKRTKSYIWIIENTILLPSHICVELDNAHLKMADGVFVQMFRNSLGFEQEGCTPAGQQEDISIIGYGKSVLDGGKHNGLREKTSLKDGMPHISNNVTIFMHNVTNFKVDNLTVRDQRWWSMCFSWCSFGSISNIHFELTDLTVRESVTHPYRNQDGIDLRVGCHDIQIRNLNGQTGDDVVALTALAIRKPSFECVYPCEHLSYDIWNISIQNISAYNIHCALVRILCHNGRKIYNIDIDHITDSTPDNQEIIRTACCVKLGENDYCSKDESIKGKLGDLHDINISNVFSNALSAIVLNSSAKNVICRNIFVGKKGHHAVSVTKLKFGIHSELDEPFNVTRCQNILIDGINFNSERYETGSPFFFNALIAKNFNVKNVNYPKRFELVKVNRLQAESEKVNIENVVAE